MDPEKGVPSHDRIILHIDYDCYYAQVIENQQPALRAVPLGIKQKSILATCNYTARRRGVSKLMLISEAKEICPDLVLADGEDLSRFRDVSKSLYSMLRLYSWNKKVERLGLDEVFLDVTDIVDYNLHLLNHNDLDRSFFYLSDEDPQRGFGFDATSIAGCVAGSLSEHALAHSSPYLRLLLASHLARYLRLRLEERGYTSACGISTSKLLSKLAGNVNKPRNQTTLFALQDADMSSFMDPHGLRKVPGFGAKISRILESHVLSKDVQRDPHSMDCSVTVGEVRNHPGMSPQCLEKLLGGPGSEKGLGGRVWQMLHGVDHTQVKAASDVPTQISIEDTYKGLESLPQITEQLRKLSASLLRRMHADLVDADEGAAEAAGGPKWLAHPKTLRLTTRPKTLPSEGIPYNANRSSRSQPLPNYVFSLSIPREAVVERLVSECLLPMFLQLNPPTGKEKEGAWNIGLLNICAANIGVAGGRDISAMFRRQGDVLREFTVYDHHTRTESTDEDGQDGQTTVVAVDAGDDASDHAEDWDDDGDGIEPCPQCGRLIPLFAVAAHSRYHILGD